MAGCEWGHRITDSAPALDALVRGGRGGDLGNLAGMSPASQVGCKFTCLPGLQSSLSSRCVRSERWVINPVRESESVCKFSCLAPVPCFSTRILFSLFSRASITMWRLKNNFEKSQSL